MADDEVKDIFVDLVSNVTHVNGVFRLTFAAQEAENAIRPIVRLLVPGNQLPRVLKSISDAAVEIGEQLRSQSETAQDPPKKKESEKKAEKK